MKKDNRFGRRNFIKSSLISTTGAMFGIKAHANNSWDNSSEKGKIITRKLGNTGIELPVVSMGVMRSDNPKLVKAAYDAGIIHFDTAHYYDKGNNEIMLGKVFKKLPRDSFVMATKILPEDYIKDPKYEVLSPDISTSEIFIKRFETSLKRLQMDYVDILYLHNIRRREDALFEPLLNALTTLKKQGKARHIGISTHRNQPEVIQAAADSNVYEIILTSYNFKQKNCMEIKEKIGIAAQKGLGIVGMKSMAGKYLDKEKTKPVNCKAALKWVLNDTNVHTTIPGLQTYEHLIENMSVMENLELTEDEKNFLESARLEAGLYCDDCRHCVKQCKQNLPVPDIMRAYMYAYGYSEFSKAHQLINAHNIPDNPCNGCIDCSVQCIKGFKIAEKIKDISRIKNIPNDLLT